MSTLYLIQHVAAEPPGLIALALQDCGVGIEVIRPFKGDRIPSRLGGHAGLVVMGGPMGVYEQDQYPFLRQEIRLLQEALSERRPILAICLGSQLLAAALDAPVTRGKQKEIGWHPVTLARAAANDGLWRSLPKRFVAYHWHGDVFELPRGAAPLAWSKLTDCQAFRYGESAYGFLFHLEVTEPIIRRMTRTFRGELREAGLSERPVLDGATAHLTELHTIGRTVFGRWVALVSGEGNVKPARLTIRLKRVYEPSAPSDGARFLVDRLWPRGVKKEALPLEGWLKAAAPSDELRRWFKHDPVKWSEFRRRYSAELDRHPEVVRPLLEAAKRGPISLLFSAHNTHHNNAVALAEYLKTRLAVAGTKVQ